MEDQAKFGALVLERKGVRDEIAVLEQELRKTGETLSILGKELKEKLHYVATAVQSDDLKNWRPVSH